MSNQGEQLFTGYPICPGIAIGTPLFFLTEEEQVPEFFVDTDAIEAEVARYYTALSSSQKDVQLLRTRLEQDGTSEFAKILGAHLEIMKDPLMTVQVEKEIRMKGKNTEYIFKSVMGEYEKKYSRISSQFFKERLQDFQDISRRIMRHLRKEKKRTLADIVTSSIIFAHELAPSETAEAQSEYIEAFVTRTGAETSHVAIMARARGIPFVSNVDFPDQMADCVIVDGEQGIVIFNPLPTTLQYYKSRQQQLKVKKRSLEKFTSCEAQTKEGSAVRISVNLEMLDELRDYEEQSALTIGLFRSEYLFLAKSDFPSEQEQFESYRSLVERVGLGSSVIRTFDLGGDKLGEFHPARHESNPYLGCRAIRLMFKEPTAFKAQLRALLRASAFGEISILFPMISDVGELRQAKELMEEAKEELLAESIPFARKIPIGCMIEVPSAALSVDLIAAECDFLSIGTNDLVQYTLAVDRNLSEMRYLYQPSHPSVLRLIKHVADEGIRRKKSVTICGEIAGDPKYTALLLGLGVDELSVSLPSLGIIKRVLARFSREEATKLAAEVLTLTSAKEVEQALLHFYHSLEG